MSYQYVDPYGNHYVRGWGNDFTEEERRELEIGEFNWDSPYYKGPPRGGSLDVDPGRITQGKFQMPGLGNRIEDFLSTLPKAPGLPGKRRIPYYDDNWNAGGSQVNEAPGRTNPEDWIMDGPAPDPTLPTTTTGDNNPNRIPLPLPAGHERGTPVPLPLPEVPGNAVTRGLPTGPKPSGMSWDDWYGQHGLKTLLGRWDGSQDWNKGGEGVQYRM